ncbi:YlmH/Sll1252 family protein [Lachnospiraceae bacterium C1.1]|nr:YlmH/Sll1252 family protein [Lachnospiraceae bacterium C1.1]
MNNEVEQFKKRIHELSDTAYTNSQYLFSDFLSEAEISDILQAAGNAAAAIAEGKCVVTSAYPAGITLYGGHDDATRRIARFGSMEAFAYEEDFPIRIIHIRPIIEKFADNFSHRDFLGAILNLGIDRRVTGDILTNGTEAYLFCTENIADFIIDNLDKVKHTNVVCELVDESPVSMQPTLKRHSYQISSERIDAIVAAVTNLSRSKAVELFRSKKVFVNSRLEENPSAQISAGSSISIRGFGKMRYEGVDRTTRKGKLNIIVDRYE